MASTTGPPFGKAFRDKYFKISPEYVPWNHGSFGQAPGPVLDAFVQSVYHTAADKDQFYRNEIIERIPEFRRLVAKIVNAEPENVVFVSNATTGVNTVLRSWSFQRGDKILYTSIIYGACEKTLKFLQNRIGIEPVMCKLDYTMSDDEIVGAIEKTLDAHPKGSFKMALFDLVASMPALKVPWERIVKVCRDRAVLSLVDGAHGIGLVPIDLKAARPDFFTSNLHKWYYTPNSVALLYVDPKHHHHVHSLPISHGYLDDDEDVKDEKWRLANVFDFIGTVDYSSLYSVPAAHSFYTETCGGYDTITNYCTGLAHTIGKKVSKRYGTEYMERHATSMVMVRLPWRIPEADQAEAMAYIQDHLTLKTNTFIPIIIHHGAVWSRWSAQVYSDETEIEAGIEALDEAFENWREHCAEKRTVGTLFTRMSLK